MHPKITSSFPNIISPSVNKTRLIPKGNISHFFHQGRNRNTFNKPIFFVSYTYLIANRIEYICNTQNDATRKL